MLFEWINSKIYRPRYCRLYGLPREPIIFNQEINLPVVVPNGKEVVFSIVEELVPSRVWIFTSQIWKLVVAVEMNVEMLVSGIIPIQQFLFDIGDAGGRHQRRQHIFQGENAITALPPEIVPVQRIKKGTRNPPSIPVPFRLETASFRRQAN